MFIFQYLSEFMAGLLPNFILRALRSGNCRFQCIQIQFYYRRVQNIFISGSPQQVSLQYSSTILICSGERLVACIYSSVRSSIGSKLLYIKFRRHIGYRSTVCYGKVIQSVSKDFYKFSRQLLYLLICG